VSAWDRDIPGLGWWLPICVGLAAIYGILVVIGVPDGLAKLIASALAIGLLLYLWGPSGRLGRLREPEEPGRDEPDADSN
jgi:hypothetical protein